MRRPGSDRWGGEGSQTANDADEESQKQQI
jgi:hypothetical protein